MSASCKLEFRAFTADLIGLADWVRARRVGTVALEFTGVYWIPLVELLSSRGFDVLLINARHVNKNNYFQGVS